MICPFCGADVQFGDECEQCNADIRPFRLVLALSDYYYNEGLNRAMVRDLSGAIENLKLSLKYNKFQIDARNLLGLVYFETQQLAAALSEWVVSVNFMPEENLASGYLMEFEMHPTLLSEADKGIRKYNVALEYCRRGSRDLAVIQLKKVRDMMPRFVPAYQLLALLYIQEGKSEQARRLLKDALRIDTNNTTTLRYLKEVNETLAASGKKHKKKRSDAFSYESGNETIIIPKTFERISGLAGTMVNIFVGLVIGFLAMAFLVVPKVRQNAGIESKDKVVAISQAASSRANSVTALKKEIEKLSSEVDDYKERMDAADSSDTLIQAYLAYVDDDVDKAGRLLGEIDTSYLGNDGLLLYGHLMDAVNAIYLQNLYDESLTLFEEGDYTAVIDRLTRVVDKNPYFGDGGALYYLGQSFRHTDDLSMAKIYYAKLVKAFPDTWFARTAAKYVSDVEVEQADIALYASQDAQTDEQTPDDDSLQSENTAGEAAAPQQSTEFTAEQLQMLSQLMEQQQQE